MKFKKFYKKLKKKLDTNAPRLSNESNQIVLDYIIKESIMDNKFYYPLICIEEMSELIKVLIKIKRYGCNNKYNTKLIEEMADVYDTLDAVKEYFCLDDTAIGYARDIKHERFLKAHGIKPKYKKEVN